MGGGASKRVAAASRCPKKFEMACMSMEDEMLHVYITDHG